MAPPDHHARHHQPRLPQPGRTALCRSCPLPGRRIGRATLTGGSVYAVPASDVARAVELAGQPLTVLTGAEFAQLRLDAIRAAGFDPADHTADEIVQGRRRARRATHSHRLHHAMLRAPDTTTENCGHVQFWCACLGYRGHYSAHHRVCGTVWRDEIDQGGRVHIDRLPGTAADWPGPGGCGYAAGWYPTIVAYRGER